MMVTGYEVEMYANIKRIAQALERIAQALEAQAPSEPDPADNVQAGPQDPDLS